MMLYRGGGSQGITVRRCAGGRGQANGVTFQTSGSRQSAERYSDTVRIAICFVLFCLSFNTINIIQITAFGSVWVLKQIFQKCRAKLRDYSSVRGCRG